MRNAAFISGDGKYRYWLTRTWDESKNPVVFCMLNPSTADGEHDDPTIRRCIGFAKRWGYGSLIVVNLFAYRATDPSALKLLAYEEAVGPGNDFWYSTAEPIVAAPIVAAWGKVPYHTRREREVLEAIRSPAMRIGPPTKDGHPRHPLYLRNDLPLESHP